ncbi:hypothetical protein Y032_0209g2092 [Ancylostoma ceylanicum]|nr:hypothetical protein Y032_0209g2092 [Ancylostoma ceylanicum]
MSARKEVVEPECAESARMRMRARLKCLVGWTIKEFRRHSFFIGIDFSKIGRVVASKSAIVSINLVNLFAQGFSQGRVRRKKATCDDNKRECANVNQHKG